MPGYAQIIVVILALVVVYSAGRGIFNRIRNSPTENPPLAASAPVGGIPAVARPGQLSAWQDDVKLSLDASLRDAQAGNITAAEMDADRAASILQSARMQAISPTRNVSANFDLFSSADESLERVIHAKPDNDRLAEHVRLVEIGLAELRSSLTRTTNRELSAGLPTARSSAPDQNDVVARAPRTISANVLLNPAALGGNYLDATAMPYSAEILEPPSTRAFADNIRVEDITFSGAAQTLDGIRWRNVVFVDTRLRYEGGPLSLQNVQFIRCTFGFTTDERAGRLASAIALGQTSLQIEQQP